MPSDTLLLVHYEISLFILSHTLEYTLQSSCASVCMVDLFPSVCFQPIYVFTFQMCLSSQHRGSCFLSINLWLLKILNLVFNYSWHTILYYFQVHNIVSISDFSLESSNECYPISSNFMTFCSLKDTVMLRKSKGIPKTGKKYLW